jgi:hypothetical protein
MRASQLAFDQAHAQPIRCVAFCREIDPMLSIRSSAVASVQVPLGQAL